MNASVLARKAVVLFDTCRQLTGTNTAVYDDVSNMSKTNIYNNYTSFHDVYNSIM